MTDSTKTTAQLHEEIAAQRKTIEVLIEHVERSSDRAGGALAIFEQNIALERIVAHRTQELAAQHAELERTLEELLMTQARLVHSQKLESIGILAAGVAHEINTPTQYVRDNVHFLSDGFEDLMRLVEVATQLVDAVQREQPTDALIARFAEVVEEADLDYLQEEVPQAIEQSQQGLDHIARIVLAMKNFSHPGTTRKEPTNLNNILRDATTVTRNAWKFSSDLVLDLDETIPPVWCVVGDLKQVFLNLIINAADAIEERFSGDRERRGSLRITSRWSGDRVMVSVSDTGTGIPEEILETIFDTFFTTKEVGKGTGQGLAIARDIVTNKHHGEMTVESTVGQGTTFHVTLPIHLSTSEQDEQDAEQQHAAA